MATVCDAKSRTAGITPWHPKSFHWRWAALWGLLIVELLIFTFRFDTESIEHVDQVWAAALGKASLFGRFAVSAIAAMVVFGGRRISAAWERLVCERGVGEFSWLALAIHLAAVVAFYRLTVTLLEEGPASHESALPWAAAWASVGLIALTSWCIANMPLAFWLSVLERTKAILVLGAAVTVTAVIAGYLADYFWPLLCGPTITCVELILRLAYNNVVVYREEMEIVVNSYSATIGPECSGFEGIGLIGVFVGAFLWSFRPQLQFPQAFALLPLGMGIIWCANVLRLVLLMALGASFSAPVADGGFHSQAGWLAFNFVSLGIVYMAWNSTVFRIGETSEAATSEMHEYAAGPYLAPLLMLVGVTMITTAFSAEGFNWLYPIRVVATLVVAWFYWSTYKKRGYLNWSWSWIPVLVGAAVFALWMLLEPLSGIGPSAHADQATALSSVPPALAALWMFSRALGSIVVAPIAEELAFRGFLTRKLIADDFGSVQLGSFTWFSFITSSVLFGLLHGRWFAGTIAGGLFAIVLYRRGRMMDAVVAHAIANAMVTAYVLLTGNWASWS